jgi:tetratricopeptide (TPR) repeat protein
LLDAVARGCLRTYRLAEARAAADQWLGEDPASPQAHFLKGEFDDLLDNHAEAAAAFARCLELDPNRDDARSRLATALVDERRSAEALPHLERLRASRPGDADLAARLGACLAELGRDTDATAALDAALALRPDDALALAERGRLALRAGDPAAAEPRLRQAVRLDPGNVSARYQLVQCLAALGLADEARQQQEQLTQLEADLKRIRELVTTGLATHPNDPALRCEAAGVALRAGLPREGLRWLESALAVDPDYRPAHEALAAYHEMAGNPGLAARHRDRVRRGAGGTAPARGT